MKHVQIRRPSAPLIISIAALIFAMAGSAVAATHLVSGDSLIKKDSLSSNRLRSHSITSNEVNLKQLGTVPKAQRAQSLPPLVWHDITLVNGWAPYGGGGFGPEGAQYAKDAEGFVHLRGVITEASSTDGLIGDLPAGDRPPNGAWVSIAETNGDFDPYPEAAEISTAGDITIYGGAGATQAFVSLEGSEFYAG